MARGDNRTTQRTLEVLEAFQHGKRPMSLSEIARALDMPVSSCHGIVRTLANRGYLYAIETDRTFYPTHRLLRVAETIAAHDPVVRRLGVAMAELRDQSGESVLCGKQRDDVVVYLEVAESRQQIRYSSQPGETKPMHASSIGKSIMQMMEPAVLDAWLAGHALRRFSPTTITSARRLRADIAAARARGYQISDGETTSGVMAVAVGLPLEVPVGVSIAGPKSRMEPYLERHAALLMKLRRDFTQI